MNRHGFVPTEPGSTTCKCGDEESNPIHFGKGSGRIKDNTADRALRAHYIDKVIGQLDDDQLESAIDVLMVYEEALRKFTERNAVYQDLWRRSGWLMNLVHIKHKADRLMRIFWGKLHNKEGEEPDLDDGFDLMNYTVFFIITHRKGDARGHW